MSDLAALLGEIDAATHTADLFQSVNDLVPLYYHAMEAKPLFDDFVAGVASSVGLQQNQLLIGSLKNPYVHHQHHPRRYHLHHHYDYHRHRRHHHY
jgi:hypothetical protein